jgi:hypothetical protein
VGGCVCVCVPQIKQYNSTPHGRVIALVALSNSISKYMLLKYNLFVTFLI